MTSYSIYTVDILSDDMDMPTRPGTAPRPQNISLPGLAVLLPERLRPIGVDVALSTQVLVAQLLDELILDRILCRRRGSLRPSAAP
jgi:hypothetical protein